MYQNRNAIQRYKTVKVTAAKPGELLVQLYDGLVVFMMEARDAMGRGDRARATERIDRSIAILAELSATLRPEHAPELCSQLSAVYGFCMDQLIVANVGQKPDLIEDVIRAITPIREGFREAVAQQAAAHASGAAAITAEAV